MSRNGISILNAVERDIVYYEEQGQTVVLAAMNGMHSSHCCYSVLFQPFICATIQIHLVSHIM